MGAYTQRQHKDAQTIEYCAGADLTSSCLANLAPTNNAGLNPVVICVPPRPSRL